jgi:hypothetical protein
VQLISLQHKEGIRIAHTVGWLAVQHILWGGWQYSTHCGMVGSTAHTVGWLAILFHNLNSPPTAPFLKINNHD